MILTAAVLLLQEVQVPAFRPPATSAPAPDPATLSIVVADTVDQVDPRPLCARPDCTALYLARFSNGHVLAGPPVPPTFAARLEMGSPFLSRYRLALIVENREGTERLVRASAGFNDRTGRACFARDETGPLGWKPAGTGIVVERDVICVKE